tara:strand:+ start:184325 stop:186643 length:2319 start_codon:yes stop_codon:yes gene_type:complete
MGLQEHIKLNVTSKLLLASMTLLLPLVVFMVILVNDRNAQIRITDSEIAGLETLVELRTVLELVLQHHALTDLGGETGAYHGSNVQDIEDATNAAFVALIARSDATNDPYGIAAPARRIHADWKTARANMGSQAMAAFMAANTSSARELAGLFRQVGNASNMAVDTSLASSNLINLLVVELPQMVARLGEARNRSLAILNHGGGPTVGELNQLSVDDWALTVAHDNLFYGFNVAVAEDSVIADNLTKQFEIFNRDTYAFHALVASGNITHSPDELFALGSLSIDATLRLFDQIAPELNRLLAQRADELNSTKWIAIIAVVAATIIAGLAGVLIFGAMTRPLQAEIHERRRVQARLRDLAAIVEQSEDSILTLSPDGILTSWNAGAEQLYGYRAEEVVGKHIDLLAPEGFEHETSQWLKKVTAGAPLPAHETLRVRKDGELIDVSLRFSLIRNPDGELRGAAVIARDIRERKKAEAEIHNKEQMLQARIDQLRVTQDELQQHRDRLEDKVRERTAEVREKATQLEDSLQKEKEFSALQQKFVSMASHEFRTPLAIIDGAAQRMERRIDSIEAEDLQKRVSRIRGAVRRMLDLIEGTLSSSRLDEGRIELRPQELDLGALIQAVCERQGELSDKLEIHLALDDLPARIEGDPALLDQVFTNLLSNAVKYSPTSPQVSITGTRDADGFLAISVADNGLGIPGDEIPRLFRRFFRASTSEGIPGTGIGLNLVQELLEMHGGAISVESDVGVGSTFTVRLPERCAETAVTQTTRTAA